MNFLLYFMGLIVGICVFLYFFRTFQTGKEKVSRIIGKENLPTKPVIEPSNIVYKHFLNRPPGTRMCPLCGQTLSKYEALYASYVDKSNVSKILIHGCKYCYKPEEDSNRTRKSDLK